MRVRGSSAAEPPADDALQRARAAADGEREARFGRIELVDVARRPRRARPRSPRARAGRRRAAGSSGAASRGRSSAATRDRRVASRRRPAPSHRRRRRRRPGDASGDAATSSAPDEREPTLLGCAEDASRDSRLLRRDRVEQLVAVRRLPARARDQHLDVVGAGGAGRIGVRTDDGVRQLASFSCGIAPCALDVRAEPQHLPLETGSADRRAATSRRTVFEPTSMTPTGTPAMVTTPHDGALSAPARGGGRARAGA